ncbi:MAG: YbaK/EbsC family protein [Actinomycetota bacterium]
MSAVTEYLRHHGVVFEELPHAPVFTATDEARAVGVSADDVVKTLVLDVRGGHALALIPGSRKLDMRLVREATGDRRAHLATEEEVERDFPGYELGALPPLGTLLRAPVLVDAEILAHPQVVFAAGSQRESVRVRTDDLIREERATVVQLTRDQRQPTLA